MFPLLIVQSKRTVDAEKNLNGLAYLIVVDVVFPYTKIHCRPDLGAKDQNFEKRYVDEDIIR